MATITDAMLTDISLMGDMLISPSGDLQVITGLANFRQAIFHRLITVPGSLVHRPTYGCGIGNFQNCATSLQAQQKLAKIIMAQLPLDPRVQSVSGVSVTSEDGTPQMTTISISVTPVGYTEQKMNFTPFNVGSL
jgi:phage baseplate assembly protein W